MNPQISFMLGSVLHTAQKPVAVATLEREAETTRENTVDFVLILNRYGLAEKIGNGWQFTAAGKRAFENRLHGAVE
jgi:hypothetical protein